MSIDSVNQGSNSPYSAMRQFNASAQNSARQFNAALQNAVQQIAATPLPVADPYGLFGNNPPTLGRLIDLKV